MHQSHAHASQTSRHSFWRLYMTVWVVLAGASLTYLVLFSQNSDAQNNVVARIKSELTGAAPTSVAERAPLPSAQPELSEQVRTLNAQLEKLQRELKQAKEERAVERAQAAPAQEAPGTQSEPTPSSTPPPAGTSSLTTASIPRVEPPEITNAAPSPVNPFAASESVVIPEDIAANRNEPATTSQTEPAETAQNTAPAIAQPPPRRDLKGQNLAIRPLRRGSVPPLPTRQDGRSAAIAPAATTPVTRTTSSYVQPTVLNSDSAPARTEPAARRTIASASTPQPTNTSFGAATVKPAPPPSALVLSSASSVTGLRASWLLLTTRHGQSLGDLQPRYVSDPANGTYRLLAGPVQSRATADRLCSDLIGQGVRCGVTAFAGTPFN